MRIAILEDQRLIDHANFMIILSYSRPATIILFSTGGRPTPV